MNAIRRNVCEMLSDHILATHFSECRHRHDDCSAILACNREGSRVRAGALSRCNDPPPRNTQVGEGSLQMHTPKGPNGEWKTGQRVPVAGTWIDQFGATSYHAASSTFPPCIDRKGECAFRELIQEDVGLAA